MSEHKVSVKWARNSTDFGYKNYNRDHVWRFDNGVEVPASAAPAYLGNPQRVDPEAAFVAALLSCHMVFGPSLWWVFSNLRNFCSATPETGSGTRAAHSMQLSNVEVAVDGNLSLPRHSRVVTSSNAAPHIKRHDQGRKKPRKFAHNQA
jgi:hypothetical protein